MLSGELLLELTDETVLDGLETLVETIGDEDNDSLLLVIDIDLLGGGDEEIAEIGAKREIERETKSQNGSGPNGDGSANNKYKKRRRKLT